jgi:RimJ/RimL family protein N-acetyltransferase
MVRNADASDYPRIIAVMKDWWGGRDLTHMLPRIFLEHFRDTSWVVEKDQALVGFLIGFFYHRTGATKAISISSVFIRTFWGMGVGAFLYGRFTMACRKNGRDVIRSCTSPANKASISFHKRLGFEIEKGDTKIDGISVALDYNRPGDSKVLLRSLGLIPRRYCCHLNTPGCFLYYFLSVSLHYRQIFFQA